MELQSGPSHLSRCPDGVWGARGHLAHRASTSQLQSGYEGHGGLAYGGAVVPNSG